MAITANNFKSTLITFIRSQKTQRDKLQALIEFGLEQYRDGQGNTNFLTQILNGCIGVKSLPTVSIKNYIKAHANVRWMKLKDKTMGFKRDKAVDGFQVTMPEVPWYDHQTNDGAQAKPDMDVIAQVKSLLTRVKKAEKEGKVKNAEEAKEVEKVLEKLLAPKSELGNTEPQAQVA